MKKLTYLMTGLLAMITTAVRAQNSTKMEAENASYANCKMIQDITRDIPRCLPEFLDQMLLPVLQRKADTDRSGSRKIRDLSGFRAQNSVDLVPFRLTAPDESRTQHTGCSCYDHTLSHMYHPPTIRSHPPICFNSLIQSASISPP